MPKMTRLCVRLFFSVPVLKKQTRNNTELLLAAVFYLTPPTPFPLYLSDFLSDLLHHHLLLQFHTRCRFRRAGLTGPHYGGFSVLPQN